MVGAAIIAVYVDNMKAKYGRMVMCHMFADSTHELVAMAERIGVARRWLQCAGTYREHFDVCMTKRSLAIDAGAVEITMHDAGLMMRERKKNI